VDFPVSVDVFDWTVGKMDHPFPIDLSFLVIPGPSALFADGTRNPVTLLSLEKSLGSGFRPREMRAAPE
jgi:hypothetical protein